MKIEEEQTEETITIYRKDLVDFYEQSKNEVNNRKKLENNLAFANNQLEAQAERLSVFEEQIEKLEAENKLLQNSKQIPENIDKYLDIFKENSSDANEHSTSN